jgi:hypothetical protein
MPPPPAAHQRWHGMALVGNISEPAPRRLPGRTNAAMADPGSTSAHAPPQAPPHARSAWGGVGFRGRPPGPCRGRTRPDDRHGAHHTLPPSGWRAIGTIGAHPGPFPADCPRNSGSGRDLKKPVHFLGVPQREASRGGGGGGATGSARLPPSTQYAVRGTQQYKCISSLRTAYCVLRTGSCVRRTSRCRAAWEGWLASDAGQRGACRVGGDRLGRIEVSALFLRPAARWKTGASGGEGTGAGASGRREEAARSGHGWLSLWRGLIEARPKVMK